MSAPPYVPVPVTDKPRTYESPPWRAEPWIEDRPAHLAMQPSGPRLGNQGPDQGFVLTLLEHVEHELVLAPGEDAEDALTGCAAVALKRASLFGRAPVIHDVRIALTVWGFLSPAPEALVERRRPLFEAVHHIHSYMRVRAIADQVPESVLRLAPAQVSHLAASDWRSVLTDVTDPPAVVAPAPAPPAPPPPPPVAEPVAVSEPDAITEPVAAAPPPPVAVEPEPVVEPEAVAEPEAVIEPERVVEPEPVVEPEAVAEPVIEPEPAPAPAPKASLFSAPTAPAPPVEDVAVAAATTAELDLVHQAREILEATAEARHAEGGLPSRADAAAQGDLPPQERKPMPPRPVRTEDITSLVAEAKGALRARQLEQAKRDQEAVAAQRRAIDQGDDDGDGTSPGEAETP